MTGPSAPGAHLEPHDVVGYLEGTLDPGLRARVQAHLADCEHCTSELAAVSRLQRPARPAFGWLGLGVAAAAVLAVVLLGPRGGRQGDGESPPVRGGSAAMIEVVIPGDGATLREAPMFTWRSVSGAAAYRISVSRADGDSVWAATTRDTAVSAPESAIVPGPGVYYWYVDALLADGGAIAGTAHEFRVSQ